MNPAWKAAVRRKLPLVTPVGQELCRSLALSPGQIDALLKRGVPFHLAADRSQDVRPALRTVSRRLAAGETLYLVNPHEYMPRLRRFVYLLGRDSGFAGRPCRTFLFRVDAPGREAIGMHDDGDTELAWLQLAGERFVTFGSRGAAGRKQGLSAAGGASAGWFRGGLRPGHLLYLPPYAPHEVACRKPSIAVSVYWEPVRAAEAAAGWLIETGGPALRSHPGPKAVAAALRHGAAGVGGEAFAAWHLGVTTDDGAHDRPAGGAPVWGRDTQVTAWRAFAVHARGGAALLRAGGELELVFPREAARPLGLLAHYGAYTVAQLLQKSKLPHAKLSVLLDALHTEGLVTAGGLPQLGDFEPAGLSGWDYSITT